MRTIWNGSLSFGLVSIPVGLAVAQQRQDVSFRTLHRECGTPIKQKRWCPHHEREVEADELVKGWEFAKGQYVVIEDSDLEAVELKRSRSVELIRFVPLDQVDPLYFDRGYYLAPAADEVGRRPYALLLRALEETTMAAVGKFVLWGKENLCLVRPVDGALVLELLYYAEDVRSSTEIAEAVAEVDVKEPEVDMARQLVESLAGDFDPTDYANEYRGELRAMLEAKLAGKEIVLPEAQPEEAPVIDLVEALKKSIAQAKGPEPDAAEEEGCGQVALTGPDRPASPAAAPGTASCRSSPGRWGSTPRCRGGSPLAGRC
jgi:DNA end-binding protein Ku